jgi:hypothetical protein
MSTGGDDRLPELSEDRLPELSDDLLRRILYFVPFRKAACTSLLSRRWRSLWRSSGAVNLDVQVPHSRSYDEDADNAFFTKQEAFVHAAKAALDAVEVPITRLTLRVESNDHDGHSSISRFLHRSRNWHTHFTKTDVVSDLVSHPAARHVEELQVAAVAASYGMLRETTAGIYGLAALPSSDTLRVLDLTRCNLTLTAAAAALALPRLTTLRLSYCSVEPKVLQPMLDAAPELTTVQLESLSIFSLPPEPKPPVLRLSFHAVTTLVLSLCCIYAGVQGSGDRRGKSNWAIEIDAPRLQSFKYKGLLPRFVLRPAAAGGGGVARVDLHFLHHNDVNMRALFWQFLHNFTNARTIKLKVENNLINIAAIGEARHALLRCAFPSMERLELEGAFDPRMEEYVEKLEGAFDPRMEECVEELVAVHFPERETTAIAIANLLDCCPVLGEFMLKLNAVSAFPVRDSRYGPELLKRKDRSDYSKSIDRFVRRKKAKTDISMEDSIFGDDEYSYDDVRGIPGLSDGSFACLQRTLRRVGLQFRLDTNCISTTTSLGLRLIKFFADHARVLEEICVDTGNKRLHEHLKFNVETQALALALAPIPISATTASATLDSTTDLAKTRAGFTVLPLQRQESMDWKSSSLEN